MKLLSLETASEHCSVALQQGDVIQQQLQRDARKHAEHLLPMIHKLLDPHGLTLATLDGIVVDIGPGSFTGIRTGISMAQGFALALELPLYPVVSLAALALDALAAGAKAPVLVVQDARMGECYWALADARGRLLTPPALHRPEALPLAKLPQPPASLAGSGVKQLLESQTNLQSLPTFPDALLQARHLLPLADLSRPHNAETLQPLYVRNQVADERARVRPGNRG